MNGSIIIIYHPRATDQMELLLVMNVTMLMFLCSKNSIKKVGMPKVFIELGNEIPRAVLIPTLNELNPPGPKATARSVISEISILETFKHFFIFGISSRLWF